MVGENPPGRTSIIKDMIIRFRQGDNKPIKDAWIRFQDLIRQAPHHRLNEDDGWNRIEEYVQYQDNTWEEPTPTMNISSILKIINPTFESRLKRAQEQLCYLTTPKGYIYDNPSLLRFYQNDDILPWGNIRRRTEGEVGPEWVIRSKFEDKLSNFMLEKDLHAKGLGEMLNQHRSGMHEQFSQILATIKKSKTPTPKSNASTFAITTRSGTTTHDPPYPTASNSTTVDNTKRTIEEEGPEDEGTTTTPSKKKPSRLPYTIPLNHPIHVNLPFLEAMIHMPTKETRGISELKRIRMSIQLADLSVKYPIGVRENLLVKINKFIFSADFVILEMDEDELVPIILGRPYLVTACVVIDVHKGKLSLRVKNETVTFNLGKSLRSRYSRDDYLYCSNHTTKLIQDQWVDTVDHDEKWIETEEEDNPKEN
ncbi:reverse transcriptase domain-containing protein [Tanacetum coccineum]